MKRSCEKCGKVFNMEEHLYICPKCNHYHSQVRNERRADSVITAVPARKSAKGFADDKKSVFESTKDKMFDAGKIASLDGDSKKKYLKIAGIVIGIIVLVSAGVFGAIAIRNAVDDIPEKQEQEMIDEETAVDSGETEILYLTAKENTTMDFSDYYVIVEMADKPVEMEVAQLDGHKLIQVNFETEIYDDSTKGIKAYIEYDGVYYKAVDEYELSVDYHIQEELYEEGLCVSPEYDYSGFMMFYVPEEATEANLKLYGIEDIDTEYALLQEVYTVPVKF